MPSYRRLPMWEGERYRRGGGGLRLHAGVRAHEAGTHL